MVPTVRQVNSCVLSIGIQNLALANGLQLQSHEELHQNLAGVFNTAMVWAQELFMPTTVFQLDGEPLYSDKMMLTVHL